MPQSQRIATTPTNTHSRYVTRLSPRSPASRSPASRSLTSPTNFGVTGMQSILHEVEQLDRDLERLTGGASRAIAAATSPTRTSVVLPTSSTRAAAPLLIDRLHIVKQQHLLDVGEQVVDNVAAVDAAMRLMDARYKTSFAPWIRDEANVDATCHHLKRFIGEMDVESVARALRWMFGEEQVDADVTATTVTSAGTWSTNSTTTLLIKLFYEQGLLAPRFTELVRRLCVGRAWSRTVDTVGTLLIGEDASMTARFLAAITIDWPETVVVDLVQSLSVSARWPSTFMEEFLVQFAASVDHAGASSTTAADDTPSERLVLAEQVRAEFRERASARQFTPLAARAAAPAMPHSQFVKSVLERIVHERYVRSQKRRVTAGVPTNSSCKSVSESSSVTSPTFAVCSTKSSPVSSGPADGATA